MDYTIQTSYNMMKFILLVGLFINVDGTAQEIKTNILDGFTNERTVETTIVTLKQGFSTGFGASYMAINKHYFLNLIGYGKNSTLIGEEDLIWFILTDGSLIKLTKRIELDMNDTNIQNIYIHHYLVDLADVEILKNKPVAIVRIISGFDQHDIEISKKKSREMMKLSEIFLKEVSK